MKRRAALLLLALSGAAGVLGPPARAADGPARVEARSADFVAVGVLQGDRLVVHLTRALDNSPVRDAALTVTLRGATHAATAEADGGYAVSTPDLVAPGAAVVVFDVTEGATHERLEGSLTGPAGEARADDGSGVRQLGWWVLNFAACIGFLWLIARRRKAAAAEDR